MAKNFLPETQIIGSHIGKGSSLVNSVWQLFHRKFNDSFKRLTPSKSQDISEYVGNILT